MDRRFRTVWIGQLVSLVGSAMSSFGGAIWVFTETGSYLWLGCLFATAATAELVAAPFAPLVDRFDRRWVMVVADTAAGMVTIGLLVVWLSGALQPLQLVIGGGVVAFASAFQATAYTAAIPDLTATENLDRANGLVQLGPAIAFVAGPAGASALFALGGVGAILAVDVATFIVGLISVLVTNFLSRSDREYADDGSMRAAVTWLRQEGGALIALIGVAAIANLVLGGYSVAMLGRATALGGDGRAGWPAAVGGVAMIAASLVVGNVGLPHRKVRALAFGAAWFGAMTIVAGLRPSMVLLIVGVAAAFAAVPLIQAATTSIFHELVPPGMRGRIFGIRSGVGQAFAPIGALAGGAVSSWSETATFVIIGTTLLVVAFSTATSRSLKRVDRTAAGEAK